MPKKQHPVKGNKKKKDKEPAKAAAKPEVSSTAAMLAVEVMKPPLSKQAKQVYIQIKHLLLQDKKAKAFRTKKLLFLIKQAGQEQAAILNEQEEGETLLMRIMSALTWQFVYDFEPLRELVDFIATIKEVNWLQRDTEQRYLLMRLIHQSMQLLDKGHFLAGSSIVDVRAKRILHVADVVLSASGIEVMRLFGEHLKVVLLFDYNPDTGQLNYRLQSPAGNLSEFYNLELNAEGLPVFTHPADIEEGYLLDVERFAHHTAIAQLHKLLEDSGLFYDVKEQVFQGDEGFFKDGHARIDCVFSLKPEQALLFAEHLQTCEHFSVEGTTVHLNVSLMKLKEHYVLGLERDKPAIEQLMQQLQSFFKALQQLRIDIGEQSFLALGHN